MSNSTEREWEVGGIVTAGKYLGTVMASSAKEAAEKAFDLDECYVSVCHQCSKHMDSPEIHDVHVSCGDEHYSTFDDAKNALRASVTKLEAENARLRDALRFYAHSRSYIQYRSARHRPVVEDGGDRARAALSPQSEEADA